MAGVAAGVVLLAGCSSASSDEVGSGTSSEASPSSIPESGGTEYGETASGQSGSGETGSGEPGADGPIVVPETAPPPYIDGVDWVVTEVGPSLQIRPTPVGRTVSGDGAADEAWREVLALDPGADTPGMRAQFDCHWTFARLVEPDKPSWNLEPGRPVVSDEEMIAARCNPGFPEE